MKHAKVVLLASVVAFGLVGSAPVAQATPIRLTTTLSGPNENPPNSSVGVGAATLLIDADARTMRIIATLAGLRAGTTVAHIRCCVSVPNGNVGVAKPTPTFPHFPAGVMWGVYDRTFDMSLASSYNAAFMTNNGGTTLTAQNALLAGLLAGNGYLNIHSSAFPGGEIRGSFRVPEPATGTLALLGIAAAFAVRRRRRTSN
jgi:MYXO-CTERM domain-containing protein